MSSPSTPILRVLLEMRCFLFDGLIQIFPLGILSLGVKECSRLYFHLGRYRIEFSHDDCFWGTLLLWLRICMVNFVVYTAFIISFRLETSQWRNSERFREVTLQTNRLFKKKNLRAIVPVYQTIKHLLLSQYIYIFLIRLYEKVYCWCPV